MTSEANMSWKYSTMFGLTASKLRSNTISTSGRLIQLGYEPSKTRSVGLGSFHSKSRVVRNVGENDFTIAATVDSLMRYGLRDGWAITRSVSLRGDKSTRLSNDAVVVLKPVYGTSFLGSG